MSEPRRLRHVRVKEDAEAFELVCAAAFGSAHGDDAQSAQEDSPMLPNTGPGWARSFVTQIASPSPNKWLLSPEICRCWCKHPAVSSHRLCRAHLELNLDHEVGCGEWYARPQPTLEDGKVYKTLPRCKYRTHHLRRDLPSQADVLVGVLDTNEFVVLVRNLN